MKKLLIILTLLSFYIFVNGQQNIGLKIDGGLSKITNPFVASNVTSTTQFSISGKIGFFYNYSLSKKSFIGTELLFIQIESKEKWEMSAQNQVAEPTDEFVITNINKHISYVGIPVYYEFKLNKLSLNIGGQVTFAIASSGRYKTIYPDNGSIINWDTTYSKLNIDSYDFGVRAGINYNLTNNFYIEGEYYYGLNNILKKTKRKKNKLYKLSEYYKLVDSAHLLMRIQFDNYDNKK